MIVSSDISSIEPCFPYIQRVIRTTEEDHDKVDILVFFFFDVLPNKCVLVAKTSFSKPIRTIRLTADPSDESHDAIFDSRFTC